MTRSGAIGSCPPVPPPVLIRITDNCRYDPSCLRSGFLACGPSSIAAERARLRVIRPRQLARPFRVRSGRMGVGSQGEWNPPNAKALPVGSTHPTAVEPVFMELTLGYWRDPNAEVSLARTVHHKRTSWLHAIEKTEKWRTHVCVRELVRNRQRIRPHGCPSGRAQGLNRR